MHLNIISNTKFKKALCGFLSIQLLFATSAIQVKEKSKNDDSTDFSIVVLPDTQYYTSEKNGGKNEMFKAQTDWIIKNAAKEKIAYVVQLGDISDDGEKFPKEWENAAEAMYVLDKPWPVTPMASLMAWQLATTIKPKASILYLVKQISIINTSV